MNRVIVRDMGMNSDFSKLVFSVLFSALFTMALFYANFILPGVIDDALRKFFPDIYQWPTVPEYVRFLYQCAMIAGLLAFILSIVFIILGFVTKWTKISIIGVLTLYLPVFSGFAYTMFLFAGLGVLRYIWYPIIRILGGYAGALSIGYSLLILPLLIMSSPFLVSDLLGITVQASMMALGVMPFVIILVGFVILSVSIATWLYYCLSGVRIIKQGIYKYSRHPQYLGLLLWCYSLLHLYPIYGSFAHTPPPALLYLVLLFTIIGIALIEEQKLVERYGDEYIDYRKQTPFLIPLPKLVKDVILWIPRKVTGKELPKTRVEVIKMLTMYLLILAILSTPFDLLLLSHTQ
jgi:Putative protein-S-isoprenylcysteine methyltransferase